MSFRFRRRAAARLPSKRKTQCSATNHGSVPKKQREGVIVIPRRSRSPCPRIGHNAIYSGRRGRLFHRPTASRPYEKGFQCQDIQDQGRRLLLPIAVPVFPLNLRCTWAAEVAFCLSRSRLRRLLDRVLRIRCDDHRDLALCSGVDEARRIVLSSQCEGGLSCCQRVVLDVAGQKRRNRRSPFRYRYQSQARDPRGRDDGAGRRMAESFWRAKVDL